MAAISTMECPGFEVREDSNKKGITALQLGQKLPVIVHTTIDGIQVRCAALLDGKCDARNVLTNGKSIGQETECPYTAKKDKRE